MDVANTNLMEKLWEREAEIKRLMDLNKKFGEELQMHEVARDRHKVLIKWTEDDNKKMASRIMDLERSLTVDGEFINVLLEHTNNEQHQVQKGVIKCLMDSSTGDVGIKRMGEIDHVAFGQELRITYGEKMTDDRALELSSFWQQRVYNPKWHPFKTVKVPGTDAHQVVIDMDDENLDVLSVHLGERACEIVMTALKELIEYNLSGRFPVPEFWNYKDNRKATLMEAVSVLHSQLKCKSSAN